MHGSVLSISLHGSLGSSQGGGGFGAGAAMASRGRRMVLRRESESNLILSSCVIMKVGGKLWAGADYWSGCACVIGKYKRDDRR